MRAPDGAAPHEDTRSRTLRAMAGPVTLTVVGPGPGADSALDRAAAVIREVESTCSRFDASSALSRANADPDAWHEVPRSLALAVAEARRAHHETDGLFDPRVHDTLVGWGYDRSLPFDAGRVDRPASSGGSSGGAAASSGMWHPQVVTDGRAFWLHLCGSRIDLGGIGKGLAVRWAAAALADGGAGAMVDAGGDLAMRGDAPGGGDWRVGIEDPAGGRLPVAVIELRDSGCATSSTRLRRWYVDGSPVHHLVDPRTRLPGSTGLASVTVAAPDPAWSEVWSKSLFLLGAAAAPARAEDLGLAVLWVREDGSIGMTGAMRRRVRWSQPSPQR